MRKAPFAPARSGTARSPAPGRRDVDVRGDEEAGQALVRDLLDAEALLFERAEMPDGGPAARSRKSANQPEHLLAHGGTPALGVGAGLDPRDPGGALREVLPREGVEIGGRRVARLRRLPDGGRKKEADDGG
jgi:hypothetical protein